MLDKLSQINCSFFHMGPLIMTYLEVAGQRDTTQSEARNGQELQ